MLASEAKNIDEYISMYPKPVQEILEKLRNTIQKAAPDAVEAISYLIPTFKLNGNLVHFAAYKKHIGFYPGAGGIMAFKDKLASYKSAKGSVQFPLEQALPYDIVEKIVKFRVKQNLEKKAAKSKTGN